MFSKIVDLFHKDTKNVHHAALLLGAFSLLSQLIGLLRDRMLAGMLGPSASLDVYYAAFKLPDFLYASFASLFSMTVLIPFITRILAKDATEKGEKLTTFLDSILSIYLIGMSILCIVCFIAMPYLAHFLVPGFGTADKVLFVEVSRVLLLSPFFLGLSNLLGTFSQIEKKFFAFALSPVLYNIGILAGIIFFLPHFGIIGIVYGVVIGAILHFLTHYVPLKRMGIRTGVTRHIDMPLVKEVVGLSIPRTIGLSLNSVSFLIISAFASVLSVGTLSLFQLSYNIQTTPLMIIGISYAVASFPALSELYTAKNISGFSGLIHRTIAMIVFISIPLCALSILFREYAVRILLGSGHFGPQYITIAAWCLAIFSISFAAQSMILVLVRGFYAMGETKIPLKINFFALFLTPIFIGVFLYVLPIAKGQEVLALVGAYSLVQIINAILLWVALHKKIQSEQQDGVVADSNILQTVWQSVLGCVVVFGMAGVVLIRLHSYLATLHLLPLLIYCAVLSVCFSILYIAFLVSIKNETAIQTIGILQNKLKIKGFMV